jgi:hypothetical protein
MRSGRCHALTSVRSVTHSILSLSLLERKLANQIRHNVSTSYTMDEWQARLRWPTTTRVSLYLMSEDVTLDKFPRDVVSNQCLTRILISDVSTVKTRSLFRADQTSIVIHESNILAETMHPSCAVRKAASQGKYHGLSPGQISSHLTSKQYTIWIRSSPVARSKVAALGHAPWKSWACIFGVRTRILKQGVRS